jgi:hypothetical protein
MFYYKFLVLRLLVDQKDLKKRIFEIIGLFNI